MSSNSLGPVERELFLRSLSLAKPPVSAAAQIVSQMTEVELAEGSVLYEPGTAPDDMYFILSGELELEGGDGRTWAMGQGAVVGVLDMVLERPHTRTARTKSNARVLVLRGADYFELLEDNFEFSKDLLTVLSEDLYDLSVPLPAGGFVATSKRHTPERSYPLGSVDKLMILSEVAAFERKPIQALAELARCSEEVHLSPGQQLFREGELSRDFCVVVDGALSLTRDDNPLARLGPCDLVGGHAALTSRHKYGATADLATTVLKMTSEDFFDVLEEHFELIHALLAFLAVERERIMDERVHLGIGAS